VQKGHFKHEIGNGSSRSLFDARPGLSDVMSLKCGICPLMSKDVPSKRFGFVANS
jgi:hypothetical protein